MYHKFAFKNSNQALEDVVKINVSSFILQVIKSPHKYPGFLPLFPPLNLSGKFLKVNEVITNFSPFFITAINVA